jgi:hypothetical protein
VVFVSGEEKVDWWHRSEGQTLYPRYELVDEFRRNSDGHSFYIVNFSRLLDIYGASEEVVQEVRQSEQLPPPLSTSSVEIPSALEQILAVCLEVFQNNRDYKDAVSIVADRKSIWWTTVADKCTRRIGIDTATFRELLYDREALVHHLTNWFPEYKNLIRETLA